jgi:hypothetical protein
MNMQETHDPIHLIVEVEPGNADPAELDSQTRFLQRELAESNFERVELANGGPPPSGTKSPEAITLGAIVITLLPTLIPQLVQTLADWLNRRENRKLLLKLPNGLSLDLSGPISAKRSSELVEQLTEGTRSNI